MADVEPTCSECGREYVTWDEADDCHESHEPGKKGRHTLSGYEPPNEYDKWAQEVIRLIRQDVLGREMKS